VYQAAAEKPASKVLISKCNRPWRGMGRGFSPLLCFLQKKCHAFAWPKIYFEAGLFATPIVIVAGECSEAGCSILLGESFAALTACGIGTDVPFFEGSNLGSIVGMLHGGISLGVVG
jgi:hypothetical protein